MRMWYTSIMDWKRGDYFIDQDGILHEVGYYNMGNLIWSDIESTNGARFMQYKVAKVRLLPDNKLNRKLYKDRIIMVENNKIVVDF